MVLGSKFSLVFVVVVVFCFCFVLFCCLYCKCLIFFSSAQLLALLRDGFYSLFGVIYRRLKTNNTIVCVALIISLYPERLSLIV